MLRERIMGAHLSPREVKQRLLPQLWKPKSKVSMQLEYETTDFIRALALLVQNGVPIPVALAWLAPRMGGRIGPIVRELNRELELGASLPATLDLFSELVGGELARELTQKISASVERGTPLAEQLSQLASSSQAAAGARLLRIAGSNETKMLIPTIFVILPVTVMFAIYPSLNLIRTAL